MINYKKAQKILLNSKIKIKNEIILANNTINRVSATNIYSPVNYPAGNNTAVDGFAICLMIVEVKNSTELTKLKNAINKSVNPISMERV